MKTSSIILVYILTIPMVFFLLGAFITNTDSSLTITSKEYLPALATLVAAFAGSYTAYLLEFKREEQKASRNLIDSVNIALLNYANAINTLLNFRKYSINPYSEGSAPHLEIPATVAMNPEKFTVEIHEFTQLYNNQDVLNLIAEISSDIDGYKNLISAINERSHFHKTQYQPVQSKLKEVRSEDKAKKILGDVIWNTLLELTNNIVELTDTMIDSLEKNANEVHEVMKKYVDKPEKILKINNTERLSNET